MKLPRPLRALLIACVCALSALSMHAQVQQDAAVISAYLGVKS